MNHDEQIYKIEISDSNGFMELIKSLHILGVFFSLTNKKESDKRLRFVLEVETSKEMFEAIKCILRHFDLDYFVSYLEK